jgi:hypothetical protein
MSDFFYDTKAMQPLNDSWKKLGEKLYSCILSIRKAETSKLIEQKLSVTKVAANAMRKTHPYYATKLDNLHNKLAKDYNVPL